MSHRRMPLVAVGAIPRLLLTNTIILYASTIYHMREFNPQLMLACWSLRPFTMRRWRATAVRYRSGSGWWF